MGPLSVDQDLFPALEQVSGNIFSLEGYLTQPKCRKKGFGLGILYFWGSVKVYSRKHLLQILACDVQSPESKF